jgi:hypothetical protein
MRFQPILRANFPCPEIIYSTKRVPCHFFLILQAVVDTGEFVDLTWTSFHYGEGLAWVLISEVHLVARKRQSSKNSPRFKAANL